MDAVHDRRLLRLERARGGDVGGDHDNPRPAGARRAGRAARSRVIRPFSSSITRRSGRSSSSGSRFCRAANSARQQPHSGFSAFSTSSCGTAPFDRRHRAGRRGDLDPLLLRRVDRRLRILVGDVCRDANLRAREAPALERAVLRDLEVAGHRRAVLAFLQRADVRRQLLGQHRHDAVGEIDAVAARPRLAVELGAGADVEADVGDRDDRVPAALAVRPRPRSHRHGRARPRDRSRRSADASGPRARRAAASRRGAPRRSPPARIRARRPCLWIAIRLKLRGANGSPSTASTRALTRGGRPVTSHSTRSPGFGVLQVADGQLAPLLLVDRRQPEALAFLLDHAEHQLGRALELLHRMGDPALPFLLGPREHAVADAERAALAALDDPQPRRRRFRVPLLGHRRTRGRCRRPARRAAPSPWARRPPGGTRGPASCRSAPRRPCP